MSILNQTTATRRSPMGLGLVVALHLFFAYALIVGLELKPSTEVPPSDVTARFIDPEPRPRIEPVANPDPTLHPPIVTDPLPPLPVINLDESDDTRLITSPPSSGNESGSGELSPTITAARVDPRHPLSQPPYPAASIRNEEEGTLTLTLLVRTDGRVGDARVVLSSGHQRLDIAAVEEAKRRWRLQPAMRGNIPVEQWLTLKVIFRLDQAQR